MVGDLKTPRKITAPSNKVLLLLRKVLLLLLEIFLLEKLRRVIVLLGKTRGC